MGIAICSWAGSEDRSPIDAGMRHLSGLCLTLALMAGSAASDAAQSSVSTPVRVKDQAAVEQVDAARAALTSFEKAIADSDLDRAAALLDLEDVPPGIRVQVGQRLALELALVLERVPPTADRSVASDGEEWLLASTGGGDISLVRTRAADDSFDWRFSRRTVEALPRIFLAVIDGPILVPSEAMAARGQANVKFLQWQAPEVGLWIVMPRLLRHSFLSLDLYQWIGLPIIATCAWALAWLVAAIAGRVLHRVASIRCRGGAAAEDGDSWRAVTKGVIRTTAWALGFQFAAWLVLLLALPLTMLDFALSGLQVATTAAVVWLGCDLVDFGALWFRSKELAGRLREMDDLLVKSAARLCKIAVFLAGLVTVVALLGAESSVNRLLAGLGIGGLAFALAAQEPLKNFFSSIVIAYDRPFTVGDTISIDGVQGVVEDVGFRVTRLRTKLGTALTIPNATLASTRIETLPQSGLRKEFKSTLLLDCSTSGEQIDALRSSVLQFLGTCALVDRGSAEVGVHTISPDGIEFNIAVLVRRPAKRSPGEDVDVFDEVCRGVIRLVQAGGIKLRSRS